MTIKHYFTIVFAFLCLQSCNTTDSRIKNLESKISEAEKAKETLSEKDWAGLAKDMEDLSNELNANRSKMSEAQIEAIGKLQGRFAILSMKKGIDDFGNKLKDVSNQVQGVLESLSDSTEEDTH